MPESEVSPNGTSCAAKADQETAAQAFLPNLAELRNMFIYGGQEDAPYYSPVCARSVIFASVSSWGAIQS